MSGFLITRGTWGAETQREDIMSRLRRGWGCQGLPAAARSWETGVKQVLPQSVQKEPSSPTTRLQTSSPQNCGTVSCCSVKSPSLWCLVMAAPGSGFRGACQPAGIHQFSFRLRWAQGHGPKDSLASELPNSGVSPGPATGKLGRLGRACPL